MRGELAEEERRDFEEHLLDCTECFEDVQSMERFVAGVRHSARSGSLAARVHAGRLRWLVPALAACLAIVLAAGAIWVATLRRSLDESVRARDALEAQLAQSKSRPSQVGTEVAAGNLPIAVLRADRAGGSETVLKLPVSANTMALWMDVEPPGRYRTFSVALMDAEGRALENARGLARNSEGAIAVILPAKTFPPGVYLVRLSSEDPARLLAQYRLRVARE